MFTIFQVAQNVFLRYSTLGLGNPMTTSLSLIYNLILESLQFRIMFPPSLVKINPCHLCFLEETLSYPNRKINLLKFMPNSISSASLRNNCKYTFELNQKLLKFANLVGRNNKMHVKNCCQHSGSGAKLASSGQDLQSIPISYGTLRMLCTSLI